MNETTFKNQELIRNINKLTHEKINILHLWGEEYKCNITNVYIKEFSVSVTIDILSSINHSICIIFESLDKEFILNHDTIKIIFNGSAPFLKELILNHSELVGTVLKLMTHYWKERVGETNKGVIFISDAESKYSNGKLLKYYFADGIMQNQMRRIYKKSSMQTIGIDNEDFIIGYPDESLKYKLELFNKAVETLKEVPRLNPSVLYDNNFDYADMFQFYTSYDTNRYVNKGSLLAGDALCCTYSGTKILFFLLENMKEFLVLIDDKADLENPIYISINSDEILQLLKQVKEHTKLKTLIYTPMDNFNTLIEEITEGSPHYPKKEEIAANFEELANILGNAELVEEVFGKLIQHFRYEKRFNPKKNSFIKVYETSDRVHNRKLHISKINHELTTYFFIFMTENSNTRLKIFVSNDNQSSSLYPLVSEFFFKDLISVSEIK